MQMVRVLKLFLRPHFALLHSDSVLETEGLHGRGDREHVMHVAVGLQVFCGPNT